MKGHKPNTDQKIELRIFVNGMPTYEYNLPGTASRDPNVLECFIPVEAGDRIVLGGFFSGTILHGAFDFLADGSFLADKRIEGPKEGNTRYQKKRKVDINHMFDTPDKIILGNLHVKTLRDSYGGAPLNVNATKLGVGSIAIVCSVNTKTEDNYVQRYPSTTCGDWDSRGQDDVADGGISPTHELEVRVTDDPRTRVGKARQQKHERHFTQTRFGLAPWATLIFHYRSIEAIQEAGCVKRSWDSVALGPSDELTSTRTSPETVKNGAAAGTGKKKTATKEDDDISVASRTSRGDNLFTTPPPSGSSKASSLFGQSRRTPTPTPEPEAPRKRATRQLVSSSTDTPEPSPNLEKKKLFGQTLDFSNTATPPAPHETRLGDVRVEQEKGAGLEHITPFYTTNKRFEKLPTAALPQSGSGDSTLPIMSEDELTDVIADVEASLMSDSQYTAPVAVMTSQDRSVVSDQASEETNGVNGEQTRERPVRVKEEEPASPSLSPSRQSLRDIGSATFHRPRTTATPASLDQFDGTMSSPPQSPNPQRLRKTEKHPSCSLTPHQILPHIPSTGISIKDLSLKFDKELLPGNSTSHARFVVLVRQVADNEKNLYYPKLLASSQGGTRSSSSQPTALRTDSHQSAEAAVEQQAANTKIEQELETSPHPDSKPVSTQPQRFPTPPSSTSKKRSASSMATSRESTPSKKPRFDALSAKKAELLKSIELKKQRKLEAQKALEEAGKEREKAEKQREEAEKLREEKEMREIEMLEKMAAEEDEEIEDLARLKEEEDTARDEARLATEEAQAALDANEES